MQVNVRSRVYSLCTVDIYVKDVAGIAPSKRGQFLKNYLPHLRHPLM